MSATVDAVLRETLERLANGSTLSIDDARHMMDRLMQGEATQSQIGAIVAALRVRGETVDELTGMVFSMRDHAVPVTLSVRAVDTCGTGGDGSGTFNISTAAAFVVAGAGCPVAKHGGRAASSRCGSADVLEALGVAIQVGPEGVRRCVEEVGMGFLFAPRYHPSMRHVAMARSELGIRTVFNVLGPLANPARVQHQAIGVGDARLAALMAGVLFRLGHRRALVYCGPDGLDELALHGISRCWDVSPAGISEKLIDPAALGFPAAHVATLQGGDAAANAAIIRGVLAGETGPRRDVVVLNAAAALVAGESAMDLAEGVNLACRAIDSGAAAERLVRLCAVSHAVSE